MGSRAPRGARGLKSLLVIPLSALMRRRAPRGARGLKSITVHEVTNNAQVVPLAGHVD